MQHICIAAIICTLFCGNLCAIFQDVFGDKSAFVVYNRFCRDGKTDFLRLDFYGLKRGIGMRVRGLQKLTLLDFPGKMGCTVKNSPEKYAATVGLEKFDMEPIYESVRLLMGGKTDFEFRTTVVRELHSAEDFEKIGEWLKGDEKYFLQNFTDSEFVLQKGLGSHSRETLRSFADIVRKNVPNVEIRGI